MPLSDFDNLLEDLVVGFGTEAVIMRTGQRVWGRFLIDPFDVSQAPANEGLNVTTTMFYYEPKRHVGPRVAWPELGHKLLVRGLEYEIVKIDRDDLGEHALSLLQTGRGLAAPGEHPGTPD